MDRLGKSDEIKLVGVSLALDLRHDVLVVVVSEGTAQLVVVHVWFALPLPPAAGDLVGVGQLELAVCTLPGDASAVGTVGEELQEELPQLDLSTAAWKRMERINTVIYDKYILFR